MQTITQDPNDRVFSEWWDELVQTHAGVPPGAGERTFAYLGFRLGCHTPPQSSCTEKSYDCREALKWNAAALQVYAGGDEGSCVVVEAQRKTIGAILDMADAALGDKS